VNAEPKISGNVFDIQLLKRVLKLVKPHKALFWGSLVLSLLLAFVGPLRPEIIQRTIDDYVIVSDYDGLLIMIVILVGILILESILQYLFLFYSRYLGQAIVKDLRVEVFGHVLNLKLQYFDKTPIGTSTTRTVNDIETINDIFTNGFIQIIADILMILVIVSWMFMKSWQLALVSLITMPFLFYSTYLFKESVKKAFQKVRTQVSKMNAFLQEHITGVKIIQIFGVEDQEYKKFEQINKDHKQANIEAIWAYSIFFPVVEIFLSVAVGLMVWFGATLLTKGSLTTTLGANASVGLIISFVLWINMLFRPIRFLAERFNTLQMGLVASGRVFALLDRKEFIADDGKVKDKEIKGKVDFKNVFFAYNDDEFVLKNLNFSLNPGETLAIVGSTGSGKSSIINVLSRLYTLNKGEILLDDIPFEEYELGFYRSQICTVLQDVFLFSGSIIDNVKLLDESITEENVISAAKLIGAHEFISKLPGGYHYKVMERGATLSLGQRQLISFLRAIVFKPAILVLDEATSSVDTETEQIVQTAIEKLIKGRTSIVIAHRLSTIQNADKIMVLNKGVIVELGSRDELLRKGGYFKELYESQFRKNSVV
jgi:ATP-binding cassette, subfamily B, multidrug efflux pump